MQRKVSSASQPERSTGPPRSKLGPDPTAVSGCESLNQSVSELDDNGRDRGRVGAIFLPIQAKLIAAVKVSYFFLWISGGFVGCV